MQLSITSWLNFYVNVAIHQDYQKLDLPFVKEERLAKMVLLSLYNQECQSSHLKNEWIINFKKDLRFTKLFDYILLSFAVDPLPNHENLDSLTLARSVEIQDCSFNVPIVSENKTLKELSWGPINRAKANELLHNKPIGSWLIRYSVSQNQLVLSYLNQKREVVHYLSRPKSGKIYSDVSDCEKGCQLTLMDSLRLTDHSEATIFKTFGYTLNFKNSKDFDQFKSLCEEHQLENIQFDQVQNKCLMSYSSFEMLMLCYLNPKFIDFFGEGARNVFSGYLYKAHPIRLVSECTEECLSITLQQLRCKADKFFQERDFKPRSLNLKDFDLHSCIHSLLIEQNFDGLIIGEAHEHYQSKRFMIEQNECF